MAEVIDTVLLAGKDTGLRDILVPEFQIRGWHLEFAGTPTQYLKSLRSTVGEGWRCENRFTMAWLDRFFSPVLLDVDWREEDTLETVRSIKLVYGAIPVIVIGSNVDWVGVAVARMDGADAIFSRPSLDVDSLSRAVLDALVRVSHWRRLLRRFAGVDTESKAQEPGLSTSPIL